MTDTLNITLDDLARALADRHGIDSLDAARDSVTAIVDQICDDPDLWDATTDTLTPAGAELVTEQVAESYSVGAVATRAAQILVDLENVTATIAETERRHADLVAERDDLIRAALRTELRRATIAAAAGVRESRLYQIRDGRQ